MRRPVRGGLKEGRIKDKGDDRTKGDSGIVKYPLYY